MNDVFNPSLVISVGPSAKKALTFLKGMLIDIPRYLQEVVEFYDINESESLKNDLQIIIDEKLLSAKRLNKLVDAGYKVRTENTANIKINIYIYWDIYGTNFNVKELVDILYDINYCVIDKTKHSGVSLFIMPILDREWLYDNNESSEGISRLKEISDFLSVQDNMINIDSKIYLIHAISNDGLRIPKIELEYISAVITYLSILPSENPPLASYNKRVLKSEGDFKIGTIGISALTVFKDRVKKEFNGYLINDLINYAISYESGKSFSNYPSNSIMDGKNILNVFNANLPISKDEDKKLILPSKYMPHIEEEALWKKKVVEYPDILENWEENEVPLYIKELKERVDKSKEKLLGDTVESINNDLNTIVLNNSLKDGKKFLESLLDNIEGKTIDYEAEEVNEKRAFNKKLRQIVEEYPDFLGFCIRIALFLIFSIFFSTNVFNPIIAALIVIFVLVCAGFEYIYMDKKLKKFMDGYINAVRIRSGKILKMYVAKIISEYFKSIEEEIRNNIKIIDDCIENCSAIKVDVEKFKDDDQVVIENLVTDLLDTEDRKNFYLYNKKDIPSIYCRFLNEINDFTVMKDMKIRYILNDFTKEITNQYVNLDFYEYVKIKWQDNKDIEIAKWIDKGIIKSKELLQYNQNDALETHKMFIGSEEIINGSKEVIMRNLKNYDLISIKGDDIYTNCISIVRITLGIDVDKITPFIYVEGRKNK